MKLHRRKKIMNEFKNNVNVGSEKQILEETNEF
jgi:hypothetical protein